MNKFFKATLGVIGATVISTSGASALEMGASGETIKLAVNEWTGQHLTTHVAGAILERAGYKVELVTAGYGPQFIAMGEGDLGPVSGTRTTPNFSSSVLPSIFDVMKTSARPASTS